MDHQLTSFKAVTNVNHTQAHTHLPPLPARSTEGGGARGVLGLRSWG